MRQCETVPGEEMTRCGGHVEHQTLARACLDIARRLGDQHVAAGLIEMQIAVLAELFDQRDTALNRLQRGTRQRVTGCDRNRVDFEMLGTYAERDGLPGRQRVGHDWHIFPNTVVLPALIDATFAGRKFMRGERINPATKRLWGR